METFEIMLHKTKDTLYLWLLSFAENLPNIIMAFAIIILFYLLSSFISKWAKNALGKARLHASFKIMLISLLRIFIIVFGVFFALGIVGLDKTVMSLMAGVGVIGLALGFAFKDLASNLISGIFIAIQNPFDIGDTIKINNITGVVEVIRLRDTVLNAGNGQKIYIPNKTFMEEALYNFSQSAEKRFDLEISVSYDDNLEDVVETLKKDLSSLKGQKKGKDVVVKIKEFRMNAVLLEINLWIDVPGMDATEFSSLAMMSIKKSIQKNGFHIPSIPTPTSEYYS